jgi:hypothetical protein
MSRIIGEKENVHDLIFLSSYITDYRNDTVALLSCHITFTSPVCAQWYYLIPDGQQ